MKIKLNENLIKLLISTDLLMLDSYNKSKKLSYINNSISLNSNKIHTVSLNPLELIKSLKQFIRVLQFLKSQKSKCLHLGTSNKQILELLTLYFKDLPLETKIKVRSSLRKTKYDLNSTNILLLIEEPLNNNKNIFKRLLEENILIINKINTKVEVNNWGTYKIYNDIADFKKLVFIIALINQSLH